VQISSLQGENVRMSEYLSPKVRHILELIRDRKTLPRASREESEFRQRLKQRGLIYHNILGRNMWLLTEKGEAALAAPPSKDMSE
jgi:hypothetical protein